MNYTSNTILRVAAMLGVLCASTSAWAKPATGAVQASQPVPPDMPTNRGTLRLMEEDFDFGHVPQNCKVTHTFVLKNVGDDTLFINKVQPGCGCTSAPLTKSVLPPGDRVPVDVTFNAGKMSGPVRKTVTVYSSDGKVPMTSLQFTAEVAEAFPIEVSVEPAKGIELSKTATEGKVALTNLGVAAGTLKIVGWAPAFLDAKLSGAHLDPKQAADLTVKTKPDAPTGPFTGSVTLAIEGGPGTRLTIPVTGDTTP